MQHDKDMYSHEHTMRGNRKGDLLSLCVCFFFYFTLFLSYSHSRSAAVAERHPVRVLRLGARGSLANLERRASVVLSAPRVVRSQETSRPWHASLTVRFGEGSALEAHLLHRLGKQLVRRELVRLRCVACEAEIAAHVTAVLALVGDNPASRWRRWSGRRSRRRRRRRRSYACLQKALARRHVDDGVGTRHAAPCAEGLKAEAVVLHLEDECDGIAISAATLKRRIPRIATKPHVGAAGVRDAHGSTLDELPRVGPEVRHKARVPR